MKNLFFAVGLGYILGTLFAPRAGKALRNDIKNHFENMQIEAELKGIEVKESLTDGVNKASEHLAKAGDIASKAVIQLDKSVHDIVKSA